MADSQTIDRDFRVLGPVEVAIDGRRVDLGGTKPRTLLTVLIANRNLTVRTETLIEALWGDTPPATARKSLQKFVWALRKELGDVVVTRESGYAIELEPQELDAARLEEAVSMARGRGSDLSGLRRSVAEWRGEPYPELTDTEWGHAEATKLTELRLEAEEILLGDQISAREYQSPIARLEELVSQHPYREGLWALLMKALYGAGRQADALDAFARLRTKLGEELGIEPSSELSDLEEQILLQDPGLLPSEHGPTPHNLPSPITSFIGRNDEMKEVTSMLTRGRLLSLLGPAGSGKTRLAVELGRTLLDEFPSDGVWFVDLAPITSPDLVASTVAASLGVGQFTDRSAEETVTRYLEGRRMLLILDNCEHLVERVAELTQLVLARAESVTVMVTSRERLGLEGEMIFDVPPLPYPSEWQPASEEFDAVRLFAERARSVGGGTDLNEEMGTVAQIVRQLDGIPLALELAAARVRTLGLSELRERLDDRFSVLRSSARDATSRHQTLEAAIDWSYRLLAEPEQTLFNRLSVFSGGFDAESAAAVAGFDPLDGKDVADLIDELADKSLVARKSRKGRRRFALLESLRVYARNHLVPAENTRVRANHTAYFRHLSEKAAAHMHGPEQTLWLSALRRDYDNIRKALRWAFDSDPESAARFATAMGTYWDSMGPRHDGIYWLERAVDASESVDATLHVNALIEAASISSSVRASVPIAYARRAVAAADGQDDDLLHARALLALSWALALDERPEEAKTAGERALETFEEHGDLWHTAMAKERLGQASYEDPERSLELLTSALDSYRELGDHNREALVLHKIADRLAHSLDDIGNALVYARRSVEITSELGITHDEGHARLEYGKVLRRAGRLGRAEEELRTALEVTTKSGDERCSIRSETALGNTLLAAGKPDEATLTLVRALKRSRELGEAHTTRSALAGLARAQLSGGRPESAAVLLGFVESLSRGLDIPVSERSRASRDSEQADLRRQLGDEFDYLWEQGGELSVEEATSLALAASEPI